MNDAWLFIGILAFLFVLWVYSGGPTSPISFSGPYITPVTAPGVEQVGYGESANKYNASGGNSGGGGSNGTASRNQSFWSSWTNGGNSSRATFSNPSQYAGDVHLEGGQTNSGNANTEFLVIRSNLRSPVSVSGWRLVSTKHSTSETIPLGAQVLHRTGGGPLSPVTLVPGGEAFITTGLPPLGASFVENKCIGYLSGSAAFAPPLTGYNCPAPLDDLRTSYAGTQQSEFNTCAQYVQNLPSCRVPNTDTTRLPASCQRFIDNYLNYDGCVQNHHADPDFLGNTWRVYLGESRPVWSASDTIMLLDGNGKTVDVYSY